MLYHSSFDCLKNKKQRYFFWCSQNHSNPFYGGDQNSELLLFHVKKTTEMKMATTILVG